MYFGDYPLPELPLANVFSHSEVPFSFVDGLSAKGGVEERRPRRLGSGRWTHNAVCG